jgi:soluble lytic murein transglycosylase
MDLQKRWDAWGRAQGASQRAARRMGRLALALAGVSLLAALWQSNWFWDTLSPITHKKQLYRLAGEAKVDPLLLAAIVREESGFFPYARSYRGAMGLMQLLPPTAAEMAKELKIDYQDPEDLYREEINLRLGTHYFAKLLKSFDGNLVMALAAYNAGPAKARAWQLETFGREQSELVDAIPVSETRAYVRGVLKTYKSFKFLQTVKRALRGDETL